LACAGVTCSRFAVRSATPRRNAARRAAATVTALRGLVVDLIFRRRAQRQRVRRSLCQRQLLLQKRKQRRQLKEIFCRFRALITSSSTSETPNRLRIFTRRRLAFKVLLIPGRKQGRKIERAT